MSSTRREALRQGLARRGDVVNRVRELERIVDELGDVRVEGRGASSWVPARTPTGMTREQAVALTAAMYPGESSRRWRRPTPARRGSMPVRLFFVLPTDEHPRRK
jgi:hypothetical protein